MTAARTVEATGRSQTAVYRAIETLEEQGYLKEVTGRSYGQVYRAPEILAIVESP